MHRVLSLTDLIAIAAASIGPAFSLATTFGPMVAAGGDRTPLALIVIAAVMACVAVAYRMLGAHFPDAGSSYAWIRHAFGRGAGAYGGWVLLVSNLFAVLATSIPAGAYTIALVAPSFDPSPLQLAIIGALWVLAACVLLYLGMRPTAQVTVTLLVAEMLVLTVSAVAGWLHPVARAAPVHAPPASTGAFVSALVIGIWMLDGWEVSASTAEESKGAPTDTGSGGLTGLLVTAAIIFACMTAFLRVGSLDGFTAHEADAMAYVGGQLGGGIWERILTVTVLVSLAASMQTTLIYLTRSVYAMGRDGTLPPRLGRLDARLQPRSAIVVLGAIGIGATLLTGISPTVKAAFTFVLSGTSFFLGVLFLLSTVSALRILRGSRRGGAWQRLAIPALGAAALACILSDAFITSDPSTRVFIAAAALAGIPLAWWRSRTKTVTEATSDSR